METNPVENHINFVTDELLNSLNSLKEGKSYKKYNFIIDSDLLEEKYLYENIIKSDTYKSLFEELMKIKGPCVYFFKINSEFILQEIIENLDNYKIIPENRSTPAIKKHISESNILYVGKVKRNIYGRLIQHLGFHKNHQTQGLQLFHWITKNNVKLNLDFTIYEFDYNMIEIVSLYENELAKFLKPIIGKHK